MLRGVYTAIITPFNQDGSVDFKAFRKLVEYNIKGGVAGIVVCGTTGESPTLSHKEKEKLVKVAIKKAKKRVAIIAGTGSNNTSESIEASKKAQELGADAVMLVNPYYNKPTQEGLYRHFKAVADAITIPVIIYNIKGRTAVNVETPTLMRVAAECKNVVAVKEASGDLNQMKDVIAKRPQGFSVLSGDDNLTLELIKSGGDGIISVVSNLVPEMVVAMVKSALDGNFADADRLNTDLIPIYKTAFIETNPIPIKAACAMKGLCSEVYRLPMCELRPENRDKLQQVLNESEVL